MSPQPVEPVYNLKFLLIITPFNVASKKIWKAATVNAMLLGAAPVQVVTYKSALTIIYILKETVKLCPIICRLV